MHDSDRGNQRVADRRETESSALMRSIGRGSERDLDRQGNAIMEQLLSPEECRTIAGLYPKDDIFRSRVVMGRHGFGRGEYKYFSYPLPDLLERTPDSGLSASGPGRQSLE